MYGLFSQHSPGLALATKKSVSADVSAGGLQQLFMLLVKVQ